jgi:hypothetical protein
MTPAKPRFAAPHCCSASPDGVDRARRFSMVHETQTKGQTIGATEVVRPSPQRALVKQMSQTNRSNKARMKTALLALALLAGLAVAMPAAAEADPGLSCRPMCLGSSEDAWLSAVSVTVSEPEGDFLPSADGGDLQ